jgi:hypothetical protein
MATCIPTPEHAESESTAELKLLRALEEQLPNEYTVLHSVAWISKPGGSGPRDGEADFLICHPHAGVLVVEVKGGRISLDYRTNQWSSKDASDRVHRIKNPFEQAKRAKYGILEKLKEYPAWQRLQIGRFNLGHAVFLPDVGDGQQLRGPDAPPQIIGDRQDLDGLGDWVAQALAFWRSGESAGLEDIGRPGIDAIVRLFARVGSTRPLLSARIQDEEEKRIELTKRQAVILDFLKRQRRAMIAGGAGTGKTLIAREKAVRLATEGMQTLLVCFNRGLADHLREQCEGIENLTVASFHQLCHRWNARAQQQFGRDMIAEAERQHRGADMFNQIMPIALANAIDLLGPKYDAIVVDEAQDFGDEYWMPIEMLLNDLEESLLYVFLDENQDIYHRSASIPISGPPMMLDRNCRNTSAIHTAAYRHYRGAAVEPSEIPGARVECLTAGDLQGQATVIGRLVTKLIAEEGVQPHEIAVLLCNGTLREQCERLLKEVPIPKAAKLGRLEDFRPGVVVVDTVARFKGLERAVIILWAFDECTPEADRETLYVAMSRAKSVLYLCGSREACERLSS